MKKSMLPLTLFALFLVWHSPQMFAQTTITFSAQELLGKPTAAAVTVNIVPNTTIVYHYQYGTVSGVYSGQTSDATATGGTPHEVAISGLLPNIKYYYRMRYHIVSESDWVLRTERTFWTQRAAGSTFRFTVTSDIHDQMNAYYRQAMQNILTDQPDLHIDLGDTFYPDNMNSQNAVNTAYLEHRDPQYMGAIGHSVPIFLSSGNHENEEGWNFDDTPFSIALGSVQARKLYYPTPVSDGFYTGNSDLLTAIDAGTYGDQYREDYYAWEWGDALFVVIDPFHYTMNLPYSPSAGEASDDAVTGDQWSWTLGAQQFNWLNQTLQNSAAKYKFVFSHQMLGGIPETIVGVGPGYVRGGARAAAYCEWGGNNPDGTPGFAANRSAVDFGTTPIHQFMVANGVSAYFHGHDHQFVYEKRDGIVYQEVPSATMSGSGFSGIYTEGDYGSYQTIEILPNAGHLRVTVAPDQATVEYVRSSETGVSYTYTILPNASITHTLNIAINPSGGGTTTPSAGDHTYAENSIVEISATAAGGYTFSGWSGDLVSTDNPASITMTADMNVTANFTPNPIETITYVGDIGSNTIKNSDVADLVVTTTAAVTGGDDIILAYATDPTQDLTISISDAAGNTYRQSAMGISVGNLRTYIFAAYNVNALPSGSSITIHQTVVSTTAVAARAAVVSVFRGLAPTGALEQTCVGSGTNSSSPSSGAATTIQPSQLLIGAVGTEGPGSDTEGTWSDSFTAGPRAGTTATTTDAEITVSMGWRIVSSAGAYTAAKTGITSRDWATCIATFKTSDAGISYIGDVGSNQSKSAGTSLAITTSAPVTAGDDIILTFVTDPAGTVSSVSDGVNTYNQIIDVTNASNVRTMIYAAYNVSALPGGSSIAITHASTTARSAVVSVFRGLANSAVVDQTSTATGSASAVSSGATSSTTQADELLIGAIGLEGPHGDAPSVWQNSFTFGPRLGTNFGSTGGGDTDVLAQMGWRIVGATGAYTAQIVNLNTSRDWAASIATFKAGASTPTYTLTMASDPAGGGTTSPTAGAHTYAENSIVEVSATAAEGYTFSGWTGSLVSSSNPASITMTSDMNVTANFTPNPPGPISYVGDIGSNTIKNSSTADLVVTTTTAVAAGDDIIIAYATDPSQDLTISVSDGAGNAYHQSAMGISVGSLRTYIFAAYNANALPSGSSITIHQTVVSSTAVAARAAVVSVFRGLAPAGALEQTCVSSGTSTSPSSGAATTIQGDQLLIGVVGTEGPGSDTEGTWSNSFTAGPRAGTTATATDAEITVSMGWRIVSSAGAYTAAKTGVTSRDWAAAVATFKTTDAGISYIGDAGSSQSKSAGTSLAITTTRAVAAGDDIILTFVTDPAGTVSSISDGANTYNQVIDVTNGANVRTMVYAAYNVSALPAASTITVTHATATARSAVASVFRGLANIAVVDQTKTATGSTSAISSGATSTTTQADELLIGAIGLEGPHGDAPSVWQNSFSFGPRLGTNFGSTGGGDTDVLAQMGWRIVGATGAYTAQIVNLNTSRDWAASIATFKAGPPTIDYTLTITASPVAGGTTTPSAGAHTYAENTILEISAAAAEGWTFSGWTGDLVSSDNPASITITADKDVTANFTQNQYTLTVTSGGNGSVTLSPEGGTYLSGTTVTLTPVPEDGFQFASWTGPNSGDIINTAGIYTIVMNSNKAVTANFTDQGTLIYVKSGVSGSSGQNIYANNSLRAPVTPPPYNGSDDWSFTGAETVSVYVVPQLGAQFGACDFTLQWDDAVLTYAGVDFGTRGTGGDPNGLFGAGHEAEYAVTALASQLGTTNSVRLNCSRMDEQNFTTIAGDYIARVSFTLLKPSHSVVAGLAPSFRFFNPGEAPTEVPVTIVQADVKPHLGDVASSTTTNTGDGVIDIYDLAAWSFSYWSGVPDYSGGMVNYKVKFDLGPTADEYVFSLPELDSKIEFEDLVIFSISYGLSKAGTLPKPLAASEEPIQFSLGAPSVVRNETLIPLMVAGEVADVRALKIELNGQFGEFLGAEKGGLLAKYTTPVMIMSRAEGRHVYVELAVLGLTAQSLASPGEVVGLRFTGSPYVRLASSAARNSGNIPLKVETVKGAGELAPTAYELSQNYPNPFNPSTTIGYAIPDDSQVRLVVYNILGEQVALLVNEFQTSGVYQVQWDGKDLDHRPVPSGVYFCRIHAGSFSSMKKMLLLK